MEVQTSSTPDLSEGVQIKRSGEEIISDIQAIIDIEDANVRMQATNVFISKRLEELRQEFPEKRSTLSLVGKKSEGGFIHPETEVRRSFLADGFKINDSEIYTKLLDSIFKFYTHWNKPVLNSVLLYSVIYSLGEYFGNYFTSNNTEEKNLEFYLSRSGAESEAIGLVELKGKGIAVCAEKASVAHNYLKFLGIDSHVIFSDNCTMGDSSGAHAYIIFTSKNDRFIFDPTNPILAKNSDGNINSTMPSVYKITEDDYNHLLNRDDHAVTVQHIDKVLESGKYIPQNVQDRVYR